MRSKRIVLHDEEKLKNINPETAQIMQRYKIDMSMRNLSIRTQKHYAIFDTAEQARLAWNEWAELGEEG